MRKIQLECIVFRKRNQLYEFLLLKRIPKKGNFWQPVCGGMEESDSSLLDAALRELKEEASITPDKIINILPDFYSFEINKHYLTGEPISPIEEHVFGFELDPDFDIKICNNIYVEHEEFRWVSFKDALSLLKWDNNKDAFKKLSSLLS